MAELLHAATARIPVGKKLLRRGQSVPAHITNMLRCDACVAEPVDNKACVIENMLLVIRADKVLRGFGIGSKHLVNEILSHFKMRGPKVRADRRFDLIPMSALLFHQKHCAFDDTAETPSPACMGCRDNLSTIEQDRNAVGRGGAEGKSRNRGDKSIALGPLVMRKGRSHQDRTG